MPGNDGYAASSSAGGKSSETNDFMKYISIDLSSFESRFDQIFKKLDALETRMELLTPILNFASLSAFGGDSGADRKGMAMLSTSHPSGSEVQAAAGGGATTTDNSKRDGSGAVADLSDLAKEIESLRAAQLRIKIDQEVAHSTFKVDMGTLRRDMELMPQHSDLQSFRAERDIALAATVKTVQAEQSHLEHSINLALSERQLAENKWKSVFEDTIAARIQDLWSGMHSTARKLQESMQFLQSDMIKQEDITKEASDAVDQMKKEKQALERDTLDHATKIDEHVKGMEQLCALFAQTDEKVAAQEAAMASHVTGLTERLEHAESRLQCTQKNHDAFAGSVDRTLGNVCADLVSCQSSLQAHQESLHSFDAGILRHSAEMMRMNDQVARNETKLGGIDGRVAIGEKKTATIATVVQEHYQEMQHHVSTITTALDHAASERGAMKRASTDLSFAVQETQQRLSEVGKLATTTELALARAAAEIPKLHALVTTNSSNVAKNRQTIRDLTAMLDDEKTFSQSLQTKLEKEVASSATRFSDIAQRDETTQQAIVDAGTATQSTKHALEDAIRYNSNMIHQLNTMVDSIAITESAEGMDDKLAKFALSVAELGLKLEHFGKNAASSSMLKEDVKADLAVLLTKVIRFLGSGVSIDQNKYLLTAKRAGQYVDPSSGAIIMEMPPQQVLENFRLAKTSLFCAKTRMYMDQLQPVLLPTSKHAVDFRDNFERKVKFVLEFGLANLFPNAGKPKNPQSKRTGNVGTCIACDRPIDEDQIEQHHLQHDDAHRTSGAGLHRDASHSSSKDSVAEEHRLRRQQIASSAGSSRTQPSVIDTKSVIRGRSGNSGLRPKSSAEPIHQAPGSADFVYRAGFRLPKTAAGQQDSTPSKSASAAALLFAGVIANTSSVVGQDLDLADPTTGPTGKPSATSLVDDGSCLEKVALVGKCQPVEISNAMGMLLRPHTAPYRTKSLPRLESVTTATGETSATTTGDQKF